MRISSINNIGYLDMQTIHKVLSSDKISFNDKISFVRKNSAVIKDLVDANITSSEYQKLMQKRPLKKFKPLRNSYTKRGDKILLAGSLGVPVSEVDDCISEASDRIENRTDIHIEPTEELNKMKTYVYRHGKPEQLVNFLDYELSSAKDILGCLYRTLEYNAGGVADYFVRPIHRMSNRTLVSLYSTIDRNLTECQRQGIVSQSEKDRNAEWALVKICQIQSNSKLINAVKTYKKLKAAY
ncbi:MAG: hypothetical protein K6E29_05640 [Cyanobacteria bacterium RUI128]|nr:hypothetical protein [Cyanobacteria bacterium RUI128]